jgi:hypothetical protein
MKQLNLWEENRHDMIFEHENQIATYRDVLYQQNEQITYAEYCEPKKGRFLYGIEWEDFVDIRNKDLKKLTYDQLLIFLKNIKVDRKTKLMSFLKKRNIIFGTGLWDWWDRYAS